MPNSLKLLALGVSVAGLGFATLAYSAAPAVPPMPMLSNKTISLEQAMAVVQGAMEACKLNAVRSSARNSPR